jgi:hypothetical protein
MSPLTGSAMSVEHDVDLPTQASTPANVLMARLLSIGFFFAPVPFMPVVTAAWLALLPATLPAALRIRRVRILLVAVILATILTAYADHEQNISSEFRLKSLAQLTAFAIFFVSYSWMRVALTGRQLILALIALALAWFASTIVFFSVPTGYSIWKYGLATPFGLLCVLMATLLWQTGRTHSGLFLVAGCALLMSLTDFRSLSFALLLAGLITWGLSRERLRNFSRKAVIRTVSLSILALILFSLAAQHGLLGERMATKWIAQGGNPLMILSRGRPELLFSTAIAGQHLFGGVGSRGQLPPQEIAIGANALSSMETPQKVDLLNRIAVTGLDVHSVIFQQWLQAGFAASIPFVLCVVWALGALVSVRRSQVLELGPLVPFAGIALIWDMFFSPWTYFTGPVWAIYAALTAVGPNHEGEAPADE